MELDKWKLDFPTFSYNIAKIFPYYGSGPIFPLGEQLQTFCVRVLISVLIVKEFLDYSVVVALDPCSENLKMNKATDWHNVHVLFLIDIYNLRSSGMY